MVGGVGDHRVARPQQRAQRADVRLVAGREDDRVLGAHPLGELALEVEVQVDRAVEQPRAGEAGAVALERVARALDHPRVAGQPEVVVGAEHDALGALHLDDRRGGRLEPAEVGQQVGLAGGAELLGALVPADLREDVGGGRHIGSGSVSLEVRPVRGRRDMREFIDLPYRLHSTSPVWVPPLRLERRIFLSRRQNPFFTHGDAQLFLAERDGRVVGRISAHYDQAFNDFHGNRWGMFGFLELEDDPEVLPALLEAAERWLRGKGRDHMVGPMDFTMNDESGVLIEGFEREPMIKQPWHPPYYAQRLRGGRAWPRRSTCSCGSCTSPTARRCCRSSSSSPRRSSRATASASARCRGARCARTWTASPTSTTRPGARTGASRPTARPTSTPTRRRCSSSSTRTGSWSPRPPRARPWRWRSRCRTSTRCCAR